MKYVRGGREDAASAAVAAASADYYDEDHDDYYDDDGDDDDVKSALFPRYLPDDDDVTTAAATTTTTLSSSSKCLCRLSLLLLFTILLIAVHVVIFQTADTSGDDTLELGFLSTIAESIQEEALSNPARVRPPTSNSMLDPSPNINMTWLKLRANPPPLSSLVIRGTSQQPGEIISDVDWMLDFAIVGFAKCGTSFIKSWLNQSTEIYLDPFEVAGLATGRPASVVQILHNTMKRVSPPKTNRLGIKFPGDIDSESALDLYRTLFPTANMIVLLRHPIYWFQSFYNFRYRGIVKSRKKQFLARQAANANTTAMAIDANFSYDPSSIWLHPNQLIGSCWKADNHSNYRCLKQPGCDTQKLSVCTNRAQFHHSLSRLGLTPLSTEREWDLLDHHEMTIDPTAARVFLLEITQLNSPHEEEREQLRLDLQRFLAVERLPSIPLLQDDSAPSHQRAEGEIDICQSEYEPVRKVLLSHAQRAGQWIQDYFLSSPRVLASSSTSSLQRILETYQTDPCDDYGK